MSSRPMSVVASNATSRATSRATSKILDSDLEMAVIDATTESVNEHMWAFREKIANISRSTHETLVEMVGWLTNEI